MEGLTVTDELARRLAEMIREQKETVGLAQGKRTDLVPDRNQVDRPTLAEVGIDKKLSSRAQKLAAIPEEHFEKHSTPCFV